MRQIIQLMVGTGLAAFVITFYLVLSGPKVLTTAEAASLPGTATVSGTVDSALPFKAAQVYFRNPAKRMLYMVYTVGGHYQAMQLFPGEYEVSVKAKGLNSDMTKRLSSSPGSSQINSRSSPTFRSHLRVPWVF